MFNFIQIAKNNRQTFYDYDSGSPKPVSPRMLLLALVALLFSTTSYANSGEFLNAALTVQSILVGFSFSVLFFLLSEGGTLSRKPDSLESEIVNEKLERLSKEIFYNVSYFNMVAVGSVLLALILLLPTFNFSSWQSVFQPAIAMITNTLNQYSTTLEWVVWGIQRSLWFMFYLLVLESMYTFVRTVGRVSYYFNKKISQVST